MDPQNMTQYRPGLLSPALGSERQTPYSREERLRTLYANWEKFAAEFADRRARNDQETMTNLRGLMILIKKEIVRLGGKPPEFPYPDEAHLADL